MWAEIQQTIADLDRALLEARNRGLRMNVAEAHYYTVKDNRVRELMDEGLSATAIAMIIKGEPEVSEAMKAYHDYQVLYKNAVEAVNCYKLLLRVQENQYEREWGQAKRL